MSENFQEQLDQKIQKKEATVTSTDISDAYTKTVENFRKDYLKNGGTDFEKDNKDFLDSAAQKRDEQLRQLAALQKDLQKQKSEVVTQTNDAQRKERYKNARDGSWELTDPDKQVTQIDDYEGTGEDNTNSPARKLLAGYLMAAQIQNPAMVETIWKQAVDKYNDSRNSTAAGVTAGLSVWLFPLAPIGIALQPYFLSRSSIKTTDIEEIVGQKYLSDLGGSNLAYQTKGLLAGYLRFADQNLSSDDEKKAYKKYLLGEVDSSVKGKKYPPSANGKEWEADSNKASAQLDSFQSLMAPGEWKDSWKEKIGQAYDAFKSACESITSGDSGMVFQSPEVKDMLGKNPSDLKFSDYDKILSATEKARVETFAFMTQKKTELSQGIETNKTYINGLKDRNGKVHGSPVSDDQWQRLDGSVQQQSADLAAAGFVAESSIQDLGTALSKMAQVSAGNNVIKTSATFLEEKIKAGESKEPMVTKFLGEKNITENYDTEKKQYNYSLGDSDFKIEGEKLVSTFKNPEVKQLFETKASKYLQNLLDKDGKMSADGQEKFNAVTSLVAQALKDSTFTFDHSPSMDELQQAYTKQFVPVWEKAGKDFDTQFNPDSQVAPGDKAGGGSGFLGRSSANDGGGFLSRPTESVAEPYAERWGSGVDIALDAPFKGINGGLMVSPKIAAVPFLDVNSHTKVLDIPGGTGSTTTEITLAEPNGFVHRVDNFSFVKVNYKGSVYYAQLEYLSPNPDAVQAQAVAPKPPESQNNIDLRFLQKVNYEYLPALVLMAQNGENPGGVQFDVLYNKMNLPCRFTKIAPNNYQLDFGGMSFSYPSVQEAMKSVNDGFIVSRMTQAAVSNPANYKAAEGIIDELKAEPIVAPSGEVYFELDWKGSGRGEGNAQVWVNVKKFGIIEYRVRRDNVGAQGESDRYGYAANFDDFMRQMAHVKTWSENYADRAEDNRLTSTAVWREYLFGEASNPWKLYAAEDKIGRPFSFSVGSNEVVQAYLDWGSHDPKDFNNNARLDYWVDQTGRISFALNCIGKKLVTGGNVANMDELTAVVAGYKTQYANGVEQTTQNPPAGKIIPRSATGNIKQTPPEAQPNLAEKAELDPFLLEKGLAENIVGPFYGYQLDVMSPHPPKNPEMNQLFGDKVVQFIRNNLSKASPKGQQEFEARMAAGEQINENILGNCEVLWFPPDMSEKFKSLRGTFRNAYVTSISGFNGRPTLAMLKEKYQQNFIPAWQKAGQAADAIINS